MHLKLSHINDPDAWVKQTMPKGCEDLARAFYTGLLGLREIPKPESLRARGGVWFEADGLDIHVSVEENRNGLDNYNCRIDTIAMLTAIEQRKDRKEFDVMPCAQRDHGLGKRCETFVWEFRKKLKHRAKEEVLFAPRPPLNPYVYLIGSQGHVKIGIAIDVRSRLSTLQTSSPLKLKLLKSWKSVNALASEKMLHKKFAKFRQSGEWFQLPDNVLQNLIAIADLDIFLNQPKGFVKPELCAR